MTRYRAAKKVREKATVILTEAKRRGAFREEIFDLSSELFPIMYADERPLVVRLVCAKLFDGFTGWNIPEEWRTEK